MQQKLINFIIKLFFKIATAIVIGIFLSMSILYGLLLINDKLLLFNKDFMTIISYYFFAAGFLIPFFGIGKRMLKIGAMSIIISVPLFLVSKYFNLNFKNSNIIYLSISLFFVLSYELRSFIKKFFNRINTFKTLKEVDAMGNGDTYEKGRQFEEFVAQLYRNIGYNAKTTTEMRKSGTLPESIQKRGGSGEQGVDVFIYDHRTKENVVVQCKHYSSKVSNSAIQEIVAAMPLYKATRGIVVTNQYFTEPAKELAFVNNIALVDRDELYKFILKANNKG